MSAPLSIDVGSTVGGFKMVKRLGAGGMATLFLGRRTGAGGFVRWAAIKVLHSSVASDPAAVRMFLDEARLSARISHPNVVHVEELGSLDGQYFLVLEYIEGASLARVLTLASQRGATLGVPLVVAIGAKVASGLHAAHETIDDAGQPLGLIHRDVSPQNILLGRSGNVKLIDFGIAKARNRLHRTTGFRIKGKCAYMAPEQLLQDSADRRADLFALGVVLWEMLTLQRLFGAKSDFETIRQITTGRARPPSDVRKDIPQVLDDVVLRLLHPEPSERYQTALDARRALVDTVPAALAVDAAAIGNVLDELSEEVTDAVAITDLPGEVTRVDAPRRPSVAPTLRGPDEISEREDELREARQRGGAEMVIRGIGALVEALLTQDQIHRAADLLREAEVLVLTNASALRELLAGWRQTQAAVQGDLGEELKAMRARFGSPVRMTTSAIDGVVGVAALEFLFGYYEGAVARLAATLERLSEKETSVAGALVLNLGYGCLELGELSRARSAFAQAEAIATRLSDHPLAAFAGVYRARLHLVEQDPLQALVVAVRTVKDARAWNIPGAVVMASVAAADACRSTDPERAVRWSRAALESYSRYGAPPYLEADLFLVHRRVSRAAGFDEVSRVVRQLALDRISATAGCIQDPDLREDFLDAPKHRSFR